jgi:hypothetical protein
MNYPIAIPSIVDIHPALADHPLLPFIPGLTVGHIAGAPIDPLAVLHAEETARLVAAHVGKVQLVIPICLMLIASPLAAQPDIMDADVARTAWYRVHILQITRELSFI